MVEMKVVVLGAGLMGKEAARDLVKSDDVEKVYLADLNVRQAEDFAEELMSDKLDILLLDAKNDVAITRSHGTWAMSLSMHYFIHLMKKLRGLR